MKLLFIHQNVPGQYRELVQWLAAQGGHEIVFLTQRRDPPPLPGVRVVQYKTHHKAPKEAYALTRYLEDCHGAGYAVAQVCKRLEADGFRPDIVLGHVGWGELTFLKQVWPDVPLIGYFEYFYLSQGGVVGFDPEFPPNDGVEFIMHARNALNYMNIGTCDLGQTPTKWQHQTYPADMGAKIYTCHDGIRTEKLSANPDVKLSLGRVDPDLTREDEIFTYTSRNMEPTRGFHKFARALPHILEARPNARVLIVGGNGTSYGRESTAVGGYRGEMEAEIGDRVDWDRVHFLGRLPYEEYVKVTQIGRCAIHLSYPFVLSWSLLESMAMEATMIASDTAPIREVIEHGKNGLLVDFHDHEALAAQVIEVLEKPEKFAHIGKAARAHIVKNYDFETVCLRQHIEKINSLVPKSKRMKLP
jgi:glycosyltransferase involved in cell wall biosynthesis